MSYSLLQTEIRRLLKYEIRGVVIKKDVMMEIATESGIQLFPLQDNIQTGDRVAIKNNILNRIETGAETQVYWT